MAEPNNTLYLRLIDYYMKNPDSFIKHFLGVNLRWYQKIWVRLLYKRKNRKELFYIKGEYSDFYKKKIALQLQLISDSSTGVKLYKVTASYRKNDPNKPHYYVLGRSSKEAKQRFKSHPAYSYLYVYGIEVCENSLAKKIISEPIKHFVV